MVAENNYDPPPDHIMHVGSNRISLIHVRLYVSDEIKQLDLNDTSLMNLLRDVQQ